jgi:lysophospholipase L1-like esterase
MHIVLLGDSIFDNGPYTAGGPAVIDHLRAGLPPGQAATLLAVDGHMVEDVPFQLRKTPGGATHFFLSVGGNDALEHVELLSHRVDTAGHGLALLGRAAEEFADAYQGLLDYLVRELSWLQVCTVYNGNFGAEAPMVSAAVRLFNDAIQRAANRRGLAVVELRDLLNRPEHYANPIEPSVEGGRVLAEELLRRVGL